jgi:hypothetical protein
LKGSDALPLAAINDLTPEGKVLLASAKQVLGNLGKKDATAIAAADAADTARIFSASPLNGDGIIPPEATEDAEAQALIKDIIACTGGAADRTGSVGVTGGKGGHILRRPRGLCRLGGPELGQGYCRARRRDGRRLLRAQGRARQGGGLLRPRPPRRL